MSDLCVVPLLTTTASSSLPCWSLFVAAPISGYGYEAGQNWLHIRISCNAAYVGTAHAPESHSACHVHETLPACCSVACVAGVNGEREGEQERGRKMGDWGLGRGNAYPIFSAASSRKILSG